ncbi:ankyrin repeat protein [Colletotrichum tofieldiae]|nr:ankyrin repeat protein [Colletotrichum tofieldiae]
MFATSRFMPDIESKFEGSPMREIKAVDQDVCRYIQQYLPEICTRITPLPGLESEITNGIVSALYLASLRDTTSVAEVRTILKGFQIQQSARNGMENAIERAYDQAYDDAMIRLDGQTPKLRDLGRRVISWIANARRPLKIKEIQHALAIQMESPYFDCDNIREVSIMLSVCAGLVTVDQDSNIIRLVHYTAQEFFQRKKVRENLDDHFHMTETCIEYLKFALNRCSLPTSPSQFASSELAQTYPLTSYAHHNWGYHASKATTLSQRVIDFLLNHEKPAKLHKSLRFGSITTPTTPLEWAAYHGILKAIDRFHKIELNTNAGVSFSRSMALHWAIHQGQVESVEYLLGLGATLRQNEKKETPLHLAAYRGKTAVIAMLLARGANINAVNSSGWSPLDIASKQGDLDVIKLLLEKGASLSVDTTYNSNPAVVATLIKYGVDNNAADPGGKRLLDIASNKGDLDVVKVLLEKGVSIWADTIYNSDLAVMTALIECGVDINAADPGGKRPLDIALQRGDLDRVKLLLQKGASIDAADTFGRTPIEIAARRYDLACVDLLLEKGAVFTKGFSGYLPISKAARDGYFRLLKYLIHNGADVNLRTDGKTPLHYLAKHYTNWRADIPGLVSLLIEKGADIEAKDEDGQTPLFHACRFRNDAVARLLIEKGADIEVKDKNGRTPLANACLFRKDAVARLLIEKGADIEVKDKNGRTPLANVCLSRYDAVARLLVEKGADIEAKDNDGRTPLANAIISQNQRVIRLLINTGANVQAADKRDSPFSDC